MSRVGTTLNVRALASVFKAVLETSENPGNPARAFEEVRFYTSNCLKDFAEAPLGEAPFVEFSKEQVQKILALGRKLDKTSTPPGKILEAATPIGAVTGIFDVFALANGAVRPPTLAQLAAREHPYLRAPLALFEKCWKHCLANPELRVKSAEEIEAYYNQRGSRIEGALEESTTVLLNAHSPDLYFEKTLREYVFVSAYYMAGLATIALALQQMEEM